MKANKLWRKALHLFIVLAIMLPSSIWGQGHAFAESTSWRKITSNAEFGISSVAAANGKIYLLNGITKKILVRGANDSSWDTLAELPTQDFPNPYKLVIREGILYILDRGDVNAHPAIPSKVMMSSNNGQSWTEIAPPSGGFPASSGAYLHSLLFDNSGNMYVADYSMLYKRDTTGNWTTIQPFPGDSTYTYRYTSAAIDASGHLYSTMTRIVKMMPTMGQTANLYGYDGTSWSKVDLSVPINSLALNNDSSGHIYLAQQVNDFFLTPSTNIYSFDGTSLTKTATTDNSAWTIGGVAYDGSYYYTAEFSGTVRTTHPTFGDAKTPPTLDTTDSDTTHAAELTYEPGNEDWQDAITSVEFSPSVPGAQADWSQSGKIIVTGLTVPGTYTITVKAAGYADAAASQVIYLKTPVTLTSDTTDNDTAHAIELTFEDDGDWRAAITGVTLTKGGTTTNAVYSLHEGGITLTGITVPGNYAIKVIASGYQDAAVNQEVLLAPSVWYDITGNLDLSAPVLSVDETVYAIQMGKSELYYRNPSDSQWQSTPWPQGQFGLVFSFVTRGDNWYVADLTTTGPMDPSVRNVRISSDRGATWSTYPLPQNYVILGALNPLTVSPAGAVYLNDGKNIFKLSENRTWSQIPVFANSGEYSFAYSGVAVNASGELYAIIRKYSPMHPNDNSAKLYKYDETSELWTTVAVSPSALMQLYTDTANGMHAVTTMAMSGESPRAYIYTIDDNGFTDAATLDSLDQARYGIAFGDGYYYTVDKNFKTIRTTNPNFVTGLQPPVLTADTTDNDDLHPLELTFTDDADWRANVTSVTFQKGETVVAAEYHLSQGVLQILQALPAGTYTIEIAATGYRTATVQQTVQITAPTLIADTTDNDTKHDIVISFADNEQWRNSVTGVVYNGITADQSMYELSAGQLLFKTGKLPIGNVDIIVKASGYPDASVTQVIKEPNTDPNEPNTETPNEPNTETPNEPSTETPTEPNTGTPNEPNTGNGSTQPSSGVNKEVIKIDVLGGSRKGSVVSQAEIVRTTDAKGRKSDQVSFTAELAAQAVESLKSSGIKQVVIVVPDTKDEVSDLLVSLPREALRKLTEAGIGLTIETRGATIQIPATSLAASSGDLYFHIVPIKDAAGRQEVEGRAKANSTSADLPGEVTAVGRPVTIETNLQAQPVTLTLPLGSYPAEQTSRLLVYIEHSDGTKEWLKGESAADSTGGAAISFTVTKFSTFTVIDGGAPDTVQAKPYIFGYEDGTFRPEESVTRGQLATILARLYGDESKAAYTHTYHDAGQFPAWTADAIDQVSALGFMNGYEDGTFKADHYVTRAEAATVIARLAKLSDNEHADGFKDTRGHWAATAIDAAVQAGLLNGYEDGSFAPDQKLSRAEAVTIINRLIKRATLVGQTPLWPDVPATHWAFGDIQAASSSSAD